MPGMFQTLSLLYADKQQLYKILMLEGLLFSTAKFTILLFHWMDSETTFC